MNVRTVTHSVIDALDSYLGFLHELSDESFYAACDDAPWSCSAIYSHIILSNKRSLLAIQRCIHAKAPSGGSVSLLGRIIFLMNKFPPLRKKTPNSLATLTRKISREEARNDLILIRQKVKELAPKIVKCPRFNRMRHPRLGMLNAYQWLRFIEIHSCHHLRQLERFFRKVEAVSR